MKTQTFDLVLTRYAIERLPPHTHRFVLKGTILLMAWFDWRSVVRVILISWGMATRTCIPDSLANYLGYCDPAAKLDI